MARRLKWDASSTSEEENGGDFLSTRWHDSSADSSCSDTASCSDIPAMSSPCETSPFLDDRLLIRILQLVRDPGDLKACALVSKRWLRVEGLVRNVIRVNQWDFLESGRLAEQCPHLTSVDLTPAWTGVDEKKGHRGAAVMLSRRFLSMRLGADASSPFSLERVVEEQHPSPAAFDRGLTKLVEGCKNLRQLAVVDVYRLPTSRSLDPPGREGEAAPPSAAPRSCPSTPQGKTRAGFTLTPLTRRAAPQGLEIVARGAAHLQELDVRQCTDLTLMAVSECKSLRGLRLVGIAPGFYHATFTDAGLQQVASRCHRIVELSLSGCEVGFEGLAAIAWHCPLLCELTLGGQGLRPGWLRALQHCSNLQVLRLESLKHMDKDPGGDCGQCTSLVQLELTLCDVRPPAGFAALISVCQGVREIGLHNCWGLEDEAFARIAICRHLQVLSVEGCSRLTVAGLEEVVGACKNLERLRVTYCTGVKDTDIRGALAEHMFSLKELKWQPDTQRFLLDSLKEAGVGEKGRWLIRGSTAG